MEFARKTIVRIESSITRTLEYIVSIAFFIILILIILLVVLRYFLSETIMGGNELMEYLFIYTTSLGAAVSLGKREHIKIDFFLNKLRQPYKAIVDSFGQICVAAINIIITILSINWIRTVGSSESPVMRIPMWTVQIIIPVGCILVALYSFFNIYRILREEIYKMTDGEK
jgi:TRAP-type transport system small permease protein